MNNKIWITLLAITSAGSYLLGYNTPHNTPAAATLSGSAVQTSNVNAQTVSLPATATTATPQTPAQKTSAMIANTPETYKLQLTQPSQPNPQLPQHNFQPTADSKPENQSSAISNEEIDKIVPAPFNMIAKGKQGELREGLRKFADTPEPNTSDANLANKMTDFILSHPRAQAIHLDSVLCKAEVCEIRLFEIKNGTWPIIFSEMALQDWWGGVMKSESVNFPTQFNNQTVSGTYVLFQRLPAATTQIP